MKVLLTLMKDLDLGWMIILKWIFRKLDGEAWTGLIWLMTGTDGGGGACECGNEPSGFIKCEEFLDYLRNC